MIYFKNWELTADCEVIARQHDNLTRSITVTGDLPPDWTWEMYVSAGGNMLNDTLVLWKIYSKRNTILFVSYCALV